MRSFCNLVRRSAWLCGQDSAGRVAFCRNRSGTPVECSRGTNSTESRSRSPVVVMQTQAPESYRHLDKGFGLAYGPMGVGVFSCRFPELGDPSIHLSYRRGLQVGERGWGKEAEPPSPGSPTTFQENEILSGGGLFPQKVEFRYGSLRERRSCTEWEEADQVSMTSSGSCLLQTLLHIHPISRRDPSSSHRP